MPIRRELRHFYPIDWPQLSALVRFGRAQGRCERCGRPHGRIVHHLGDGRWWDEEAGIWRDGRGREIAPPAYGEYKRLRSRRSAGRWQRATAPPSAATPRPCRGTFGSPWSTPSARRAAGGRPTRRSCRPCALAAAAAVLADGTTAGPTLEAAITAVARLGGRDAEAWIAARLDSAAYRPIARNRAWRQALPNGARFAALRLALDDGDRRATDLVLHAIGALGYGGTVRLVRAALATGGERARANAIEALMSLAHRHLLLPLLPILDPEGAASGGGGRWYGLDAAAVLAEAESDPDPWVHRGAAFARGEAEGEIMNRLLFLRTVPLFAAMSLDDLVSVDAALEQEEYLAGEAVITEGEIGDRLYLIQRGEVRITAGGREIARLGASEYFGEMAMFDYSPRSATVVALTGCAMLTLKRDRFRSLVAQRPSVLMQICRVFGDRLRSMNRRIVSDNREIGT